MLATIDLHVHESCMRVAVRVLHSCAFIIMLFPSTCTIFILIPYMHSLVQYYFCAFSAKPGQPRGTSGSIIHATLDHDDQSEDSEMATGIVAIASLNWNPPENHNETAIDFYELTLIGTPNNNTFFYRATGNMAQQTFSSEYVLPGGNYTAVRITAIDLCEQRSDPSQIMLNNIATVPNTCTSESVVTPCAQTDELNDNMQHTINILIGIFVPMIAIVFITALIIIVVLKLTWIKQKCRTCKNST